MTADPRFAEDKEMYELIPIEKLEEKPYLSLMRRRIFTDRNRVEARMDVGESTTDQTQLAWR